MSPGDPLQVSDPCLVVLVGPAGCGKSTFARQHFDPFEVLSSDDLRGLVAGDPGDQSASSAAFSLLRHALEERLKRRRLTVVDATSVTRRDRRRLLGVARRHDVPAVAVVFDLPLAVCQHRAVMRPDRHVGPDVVERQHATLHRHLAGIHDEGFEQVVVVTEDTDLAVLQVDRRPAGTAPDASSAYDTAGRPPAVVVDLDGTLTSAAWRTHHLEGGRKDWPAFFAGMDRDAPVQPLVELVQWVSAHASIVLLTGRPDDHEAVVRRWLADHRVVYDELHMRAAGDRRPDTVVKRERYRRDISPRHDVRLVVDDRPGVIEMWRQEGLYVLTAVDPHLDPLPGRASGAYGPGASEGRDGGHRWWESWTGAPPW